MFYITGDTHGMTDWEKLNTTNFPEQKYMSDYYDFLIIVGDFGGIWDGAEQDSTDERRGLGRGGRDGHQLHVLPR